MTQSSSYIRCFLPNGFPTKSVIGNDADKVIEQIGDRATASSYQFRTPMGRVIEGPQFQVTEAFSVQLSTGLTFFHVDEILIYERVGNTPTH
jgi:hypothetical protein